MHRARVPLAQPPRAIRRHPAHTPAVPPAHSAPGANINGTSGHSAGSRLLTSRKAKKPRSTRPSASPPPSRSRIASGDTPRKAPAPAPTPARDPRSAVAARHPADRAASSCGCTADSSRRRRRPHARSRAAPRHAPPLLPHRLRERRVERRTGRRGRASAARFRCGARRPSRDRRAARKEHAHHECQLEHQRDTALATPIQCTCASATRADRCPMPSTRQIVRHRVAVHPRGPANDDLRERGREIDEDEQPLRGRSGQRASRLIASCPRARTARAFASATRARIASSDSSRRSASRSASTARSSPLPRVAHRAVRVEVREENVSRPRTTASDPRVYAPMSAPIPATPHTIHAPTIISARARTPAKRKHQHLERRNRNEPLRGSRDVAAGARGSRPQPPPAARTRSRCAATRDRARARARTSSGRSDRARITSRVASPSSTAPSSRMGASAWCVELSETRTMRDHADAAQ